jgi:prepilin-type N-terminal cleavage/methylation domain-containing protein
MFFPGTRPQKRMDNMKTAGIPKGFTLVEVIIVMALITILTSFAVPAWQRYTVNAGVKTATREIMADILQTRQRAIAENINTYQLTFSYSDNSYSLSRSDTGVTLWTKNLTDFGNDNVLWWAWFSDGTNVLKFQRRGILTNQGNIWVRNHYYNFSYITAQTIGRPYVQFYMSN